MHACTAFVGGQSRAVKTGLTGFADSLGTFTSSLKVCSVVCVMSEGALMRALHAS